MSPPPSSTSKKNGLASDHFQVENIVCNSKWYQETRTNCESFKSMGEFLKDEVQARQVVNAEIGSFHFFLLPPPSSSSSSPSPSLSFLLLPSPYL
jgi:hypothetical protein